jgi:hypothetical protein
LQTKYCVGVLDALRRGEISPIAFRRFTPISPDLLTILFVLQHLLAYSSNCFCASLRTQLVSITLERQVHQQHQVGMWALDSQKLC